MTIRGIPWEEMFEEAWRVRRTAVLVLSETAVGAVAYTREGNLYAGANVEHPWAAIIHSEVNAISGMAAGGERLLDALAIVAERELFTPCGNCLDWVFFFGGPECQIGFQGTPGGEPQIWTASDLMPHYPG